MAQAEVLEKLGLPAERRDVGNQAGSPPWVAAERLPAGSGAAALAGGRVGEGRLGLATSPPGRQRGR